MSLNHLGPDLILFNGKVITVDDRFSIADAIAVKGDRIIGVGAGDEFRRHADDHTRLIDARGSAVIPGLIDAHGHVLSYGLSLLRVDLTGSSSEQEAVGRVADFLQANSQVDWIQGRGWNQVLWDSNEFPAASSLDGLGGSRGSK